MIDKRRRAPHVYAQSAESAEAYGFLAGSRRCSERARRRVRVGERVGVLMQYVERFQRSATKQVNFSATRMRKSRTVKHLASQTKHLSLPRFIFASRINL